MATETMTKEERRAIAREIAAEGAVLLKNEGKLLPFAPGTRVAVFGRTQIDTVKGGTGSANCHCEYTVSLLDGMLQAGICVDTELAERYRTWSAANPIQTFGVWGSGMHCAPEMPVGADLLENLRADAAVVIIGRSAGENEDVAYSDGDWYLSDDEKGLMLAVTERFPGKTAVILNSGGMIDLSFLDTYGVAALLHCFMPGMEGARAVGDILCGKVTPSGKLTSTVARNYEDYPSAGHFGQTGGGIIQDYVEDVYVGYRYFLTFAKDRIRYPFGFGLSYTDFEISDVSVAEKDGQFTVLTRVTNTGTVYSGKEVVQVYFSAPQPQDGAHLYKPARTLAGFAKTDLLAPGESRTVRITFGADRFASFDDTGVTGHKDCYVTEAGDYRIYVGTSSLTENCVFTHHVAFPVFGETMTHLPTTLPARLTGDGSLERLETVPADPKTGIRIASEGKTAVPAGLYCEADAPVGEDLSCLQAGQSVVYRLIAGVSGGYMLKLDGAAEGRFSEYADLSINDVVQADFDPELADPRGQQIVLPTGVCSLRITAKKPLPALRALIFEKTNPVIHVAGTGSTAFPATDFCESAYGINIRHFPDGGDGTPVSFLSNFWNPGKYATYKLYVEEAGIYDMTIRYANYKDDTTLSEACALFVSNVGQTVAPVPMIHTCQKNDPLHLTAVTEPVQIALPFGECYLKLVSAMWEFPDVESFSLTRSERGQYVGAKREVAQEEQTGTSGFYGVSLIEDDRDEMPAGIQLCDVADGRHTLEELASSMPEDDLIRLVSGNSRNKNGIGVSGCLCAGLLRYGIPPLETADGPLGLRINVLTTAFPSGSMLSSSWNTALAETFGRAVGAESAEYDVDIWLAPGINLYRDPRCGRNFEYYAEDPLLSGRIAAGVTRGVQESGTSVCVKHYAANNTEHERLKSDSRVSARALRELYLRCFEVALTEGDPWCVMTSYNHVNDRKASEQRELITEIAHGEWGWDGVIMSDWDNDSSHVKELLAGQDVKMSSGDAVAIAGALSDGTLCRHDLEVCAARILRLVLKTRAYREYRRQNG